MKPSAGLLMYRPRKNVEVFLVHPGGPIWAGKELESWTMPKGEYEHLETPLEAAQREFTEETGFQPHGPYIFLGELKQLSGKMLTAFAFEGDCDASALVSNTCQIEWPPHTGQTLEIPEIDRGKWFTLAGARPMIRPGQIAFLERLMGELRTSLQLHEPRRTL